MTFPKNWPRVVMAPEVFGRLGRDVELACLGTTSRPVPWLKVALKTLLSYCRERSIGQANTEQPSRRCQGRSRAVVVFHIAVDSHRKKTTRRTKSIRDKLLQLADMRAHGVPTLDQGGPRDQLAEKIVRDEKTPGKKCYGVPGWASIGARGGGEPGRSHLNQILFPSPHFPAQNASFHIQGLSNIARGPGEMSTQQFLSTMDTRPLRFKFIVNPLKSASLRNLFEGEGVGGLSLNGKPKRNQRESHRNKQKKNQKETQRRNHLFCAPTFSILSFVRSRFMGPTV